MGSRSFKKITKVNASWRPVRNLLLNRRSDTYRHHTGKGITSFFPEHKKRTTWIWAKSFWNRFELENFGIIKNHEWAECMWVYEDNKSLSKHWQTLKIWLSCLNNMLFKNCESQSAIIYQFWPTNYTSGSFIILCKKLLWTWNKADY